MNTYAMSRSRKTPFSETSACLAPGDSANHLDHLAAVADVMEVPIVTEEEKVVDLLERYYPQACPLFIPHRSRTLEFLAARYNLLFVTSTNYRRDLSPFLQLLFQKEMRFCYCPHGHSDKPVTQFREQDLSLIYGDHMESQLREENLLSYLRGYVRTGNYRLTFYQKYAQWFNELIEEEVFSDFDKQQLTWLYAPTWQDAECSSSLLELGLSLIEQLPDHYNLVIKLHPWSSAQEPGFVTMIQERYRNKKNLKILDLFPPVLPLLSRVDIYLGDFSSVGYDFLYFNRPMFFFDPSLRLRRERKGSNLLHSCGILIPPHAYSHLYDFASYRLKEQKSLHPRRSSLYQKTFGRERTYQEIRQNLSLHL